MLKRVPVLLLLVTYLVTSTGFAINLHYCGKRVAKVSLVKKASCCEKSARPMKCCHDKQVAVKITGKYFQAEKTPIAKPLSFLLPALSVARFSAAAASPGIRTLSFSHGPPGFHQPPLFLTNRVFRI